MSTKKHKKECPPQDMPAKTQREMSATRYVHKKTQKEMSAIRYVRKKHIKKSPPQEMSTKNTERNVRHKI